MSLFECVIKTFQIWYAMFWFDTQTKTNYILKTFRGEESLPDQKQSCISWKMKFHNCIHVNVRATALHNMSGQRKTENKFSREDFKSNPV